MLISSICDIVWLLSTEEFCSDLLKHTRGFASFQNWRAQGWSSLRLSSWRSHEGCLEPSPSCPTGLTIAPAEVLEGFWPVWATGPTLRNPCGWRKFLSLLLLSLSCSEILECYPLMFLARHGSCAALAAGKEAGQCDMNYLECILPNTEWFCYQKKGQGMLRGKTSRLSLTYKEFSQSNKKVFQKCTRSHNNSPSTKIHFKKKKNSLLPSPILLYLCWMLSKVVVG